MADQASRLIAQALRFAESGAEPAEARLAATVLLLRPDPASKRAPLIRRSPDQGRPPGAGFQVFLLRRAASMSFASGMYAFPGGAIDPEDYHGQPVAGRWAARLGLPDRAAQAVVRAAVREVAEETRVRVEPRALVPWTRWITPEFEPRRYDTYFFLAALPAGERAENASGEADRVEWVRPTEAVARFEAGEIAMLPPTIVTLGELAGFDAIDDAFTAAAGRDTATPVLPRVEHGPDGTPRLVL